MTKVIYTKAATKTLRRMAENVRANIVSKIEQYARAPATLANNVSKLQGRPGHRLRVGNWRVIFERTEEEGSEAILILDVMPRGDEYRR